MCWVRRPHVGQYYDDFPQVTDEEVVALLERNRRAAIPAVVPYDRSTVQALWISRADIEAVTTKEHAELKRRESAYCGDRSPLSVSGKTVIVVDDGVATGASMRAGIQALRQLRPARIVIAVPVAPHPTRKRLAREVDDFVCVAAPEPFFAERPKEAWHGK